MPPTITVTHTKDAEPTSDIGHNSGFSGERLKSIVKRIEKLEEDKAAIATDIKEVYSEAKGTGLHPPIIRKIIRERKIEIEKLREERSLLELYRCAIGMED